MASLPSCAFHKLLGQLGAEHDREVAQLRADLSRLRARQEAGARDDEEASLRGSEDGERGVAAQATSPVPGGAVPHASPPPEAAKVAPKAPKAPKVAKVATPAAAGAADGAAFAGILPSIVPSAAAAADGGAGPSPPPEDQICRLEAWNRPTPSEESLVRLESSRVEEADASGFGSSSSSSSSGLTGDDVSGSSSRETSPRGGAGGGSGDDGGGAAPDRPAGAPPDAAPMGKQKSMKQKESPRRRLHSRLRERRRTNLALNGPLPSKGSKPVPIRAAAMDKHLSILDRCASRRDSSGSSPNSPNRNQEKTIELHDQWADLEREFEASGPPMTTKQVTNPNLAKFRSSMSLRGSRAFDDLVGSHRALRCGVGRLVASPASRKRLCWDFLGITLLVVDLISIPLQVFEEGREDADYQKGIRYFSSIFWTVDIGASFFVGFHRKGAVEMSMTKIAKHYMKSWFFLDVTLVTMDWVFLILGEFTSHSNKANTQGAARAAKFSRGMRAFRLLRLMKFRVIMNEFTGRVTSEEWRTAIYIAKLILIIVFVNHFVGCGFYGLHYLASEGPDGTPGWSWVKKNFVEDEGVVYRYWTSLHWSLTQFTPASMEVNPVNGLERFYVVCVLLFALVTFSSFVSSITTAMTHLRTYNSRKLQEELRLRRYLAEHDISSELTGRVTHFVHERSQHGSLQGRTREDEVELFKLLPESLKHALRREAFMPMLTTHPFFACVTLMDPEVVANLCKKSVSERFLVVRDELFGHGKEVTHMLFVVNGCLAYYYVINGAIMDDKVKASHWACELALWSKHPEHCNAFVAETNCDVCLLNASDFRDIVVKHTSVLAGIVKYAAAFVQEAANVSQRCRKQVVMCNDSELARERLVSAFDYLMQSVPGRDGSRISRVRPSHIQSLGVSSHRSSGVSHAA